MDTRFWDAQLFSMDTCIGFFSDGAIPALRWRR